MFVIVGLVVLVVAIVVAVAGVLANGGGAHPLLGHFAVFGYHVTGSTGQLFLYGIVVGAIGIAGLSMLLAGARRTSRRGRTARRELKSSRRDTASMTQDRDNLAAERENANANANVDARGASADTAPRGGHRADSTAAPENTGRLHFFGHRSAGREPVGVSHGDERP